MITGDEDAVLDCKEHLLQLEDDLVSICISCQHTVVVVLVVVVVARLLCHVPGIADNLMCLIHGSETSASFNMSATEMLQG